MIHEQLGSQISRHDGLPSKGCDAVSLVPTMLLMFRENARAYQPEGLAAETGDPNAAIANVHRLLREGRVITRIHVSLSGTLFAFTDFTLYYTPALRAGGDGRETEGLAEIAHAAGWGDLEELLDLYHALDQYEGDLPDVLPDDRDNLRSCPSRLFNGQTVAYRACERN